MTSTAIRAAGISGVAGEPNRGRSPTSVPSWNCRSGPCPRFRAQGALLHGNGAGGQRSGSHPRIAPICPAIADRVRSYEEPHGVAGKAAP